MAKFTVKVMAVLSYEVEAPTEWAGIHWVKAHLGMGTPLAEVPKATYLRAEPWYASNEDDDYCDDEDDDDEVPLPRPTTKSVHAEYHASLPNSVLIYDRGNGEYKVWYDDRDFFEGKERVIGSGYITFPEAELPGAVSKILASGKRVVVMEKPGLESTCPQYYREYTAAGVSERQVVPKLPV